MNLKISIITVCFNVEDTIEKTMDSVFSQSYDNIEYIIVDGLSKDNTNSIIMSKIHEDTIYISEQDNGIYDAMNKAIDLASGDFLIFINSGDLLAHEEVISKAVSFIDNQDQVYCYSFESMIEINGFTAYRYYQPRRVRFTLPTSHNATFFPKSGLKYNLNYPVCADYNYYLHHIITRKIPVKLIDFPILYYPMGGFSEKRIISGIKERFFIYSNFYPKLESLYLFLSTYIRTQIFLFLGNILPESMKWKWRNRTGYEKYSKISN